MLKNIFAVCALGFVTAVTANATPIAPGGVISSPSTLAFGGTVLQFISGPFNSGTFMGGYQETVYQDPNNVYCHNCLDFVYKVVDASGDSIQHVTGYNFTGYLTSVGFTNDTPFNNPQVDPDQITRTNSGDTINFNFFDGAAISAGDYSGDLVVQTNALNWASTGIVSEQDGASVNEKGLDPTGAPFSPVPEPSSFLLLGTGLLGIAGIARHKFGV